MPPFLKTALPRAAALALFLTSLGALADSTSSASSAASTSIGSSSTSIEKSSNSSSTRDQTAQGQYAIVEMTAMAEQPDMVRLRLQPLAQGGEFFLRLPRQAAERAALAAGLVVAVEQRPYGLAFGTVNAAGGTSPFYLVLDDAWFNELASRPVGA